MNDQQLRRAITDLAAVHDQGQLADLQIDFATACREAGGLPDSEERTRQVARLSAGDLAKARDIARAASRMFNKPEAECYAIACDSLVRDPWSDIGLEVIEQFAPKPTPQPTSGTQPARRRKW